MSRPRLTFQRHFTTPGSHAEDCMAWSRRTVTINDPERGVVFEQPDVEAPADWSDTAVAVTASRYFAGRTDGQGRERSVRGLVERVVGQLSRWGREGGYFTDEASAEAWAEDLRYLLLTQRASFNSPVWFNVGVSGSLPQAAACVISSVADSRRSMFVLDVDHPDVPRFIDCKAAEERKAWALIDAG